MRTLALGILAILLGLVLFGYVTSSPEPVPTYYDLAKEQIAIDQARAIAPAWVIASWLGIVGIPALLLGAGAVALYKFFRKPPTVKPDNAGRLPVLLPTTDRDPYFALSAAALLDGYHATERTRATIQPVPTSYAPHTSYSYAPHTASTTTSSGPASGVAQLADPGVVPLTLPDAVTLAEYMPQIKPHCIAFGIDGTGRLLQAPLSQSYHLLSSGQTRSGKSNSLNLILAQLLYQQRAYGLQAAISVLDYKRELSNIWKRSALVDLSTTDPREMVDLLHDLVHGDDGLLKRQDRFDQEGRKRGRVFNNLIAYEQGTGERLKRHYICIDELNAVLTAAEDKSLADELAQILYLGAGAGFFVIGGAHSLDTSTFRRAAKEQFASRLLFGQFSQGDVNLLFGNLRIEDEVIAVLDGRQGRGLVKLVSHTKPMPFQALEVEESDILPFIDQKPEPKQIAVQQQLMAETIEVAEALDHPITDAVRKAIWRKKKANVTKAETIWQLWSIRKGGNERYQAYAALYDQVIALGEPDGV